MVSHAPAPPLSFLPSPSVNGFHVGPLFVHVYGLMYVIGIALAIYITRRRWRAAGGDPALVADVATWAVPAGIIGGRVYFDITTPDQIPHVWYGVFAVWTGGLGIWGGIAFGAAAGIWRVRRTGASAGDFGNAIAPALLVAQAVGRVGNYFNQELFGKPSGLPWALEISHAHRVSSGLPAQYLADRTFQPTFLYELIWDLALAAALVWLGHHRKIRPLGPVRAVHRRLLGVPHLRGVAADRHLRAFPGPAAELLRGHDRHDRRAGLVHGHPAPRCPYRAAGRLRPRGRDRRPRGRDRRPERRPRPGKRPTAPTPRQTASQARTGTAPRSSPARPPSSCSGS